MSWDITGTLDSNVFFDDHLGSILSADTQPLPAVETDVAGITVRWSDEGQRRAYVQALGGSVDDRLVAIQLVLDQLKGHGYRQATWDPMGNQFRKTADWNDIMMKAKRLIQSGNVRILRNGYNNIVAKVKGDHGTYDTEIFRQDPASRAITGSDCTCGWGEFQNQPRTRQWKKFQDRPCAHILAAYWSALGTPIDEDVHPSGGPQQGGPETFGQPPGFDDPGSRSFGPEESEGFSAGPGGGGAQNGAPAPSGPPPSMPGASGSPADVLPQFPMANQPQTNPASIPGLKGPTPTDPIQMPAGPGGTFSSIQPWHGVWDRVADISSGEDDTIPSVDPPADFEWKNPNLVQLRYPDTATYVGRPESGLAGTQMDMKPGSVGEIRGIDPSTGMVEVLWMGKQFDEMGKLQPFGATGWHFKHYLIPRGDLKHPGPAIRRVRRGSAEVR